MKDVYRLLDRLTDVIVLQSKSKSMRSASVTTCSLLKDERDTIALFITYMRLGEVETVFFRINSGKLYSFDDSKGDKFNISSDILANGILQTDGNFNRIELQGIGSFLPCHHSPCLDIISETNSKFEINRNLPADILAQFNDGTFRKWEFHYELA
jgi:hypothetical protein